MVRKLVKTLLSLLLMAPAAALALGLGDVQLHSALNERLDADIKLLSVNPDEADTISVSLASYDDFAKLGLERPGSLMFLRFKVEKSPSGQYSIKLSSKDVIREPFLDFVIEVKWRSGRVLREYTLLLDPPVSHREAAPVVTAPSVTAATTAPTAAAPQPAEDEFVPPPSSIPVAPGVKAPSPVAEAGGTAPKPVAKPKKPQAAPVSAAPRAPKGAIVYGPVKSGDTLWGIALKVRPNNNVSAQQMMTALLKANPYAFFDNNINRLKKGFVLRIDDPSMITAMSKAEAAREVSRQTRAWQDYRAAAAEKAKKRMPVAATKKTPAGAVASAKKEPKLELVVPDGKSEQPGKAGGKSPESVQKQLMLALESSAAQRKENEDLQKRVNGLEDQVKDMKRLLALKDSDLAALQTQLRKQGKGVSLPSEKAKPAEEPLVVKPEEKVAAEKETAAEGKTPATETPSEEGAKMPETTEKMAAETQAEKKPVAVEEKPAPPAKPAPAPKKPVVKKPVAKPPVIEEPGIVDILMDNLTIAMAGLAGILVLVLLAFWLKRRRSGGFQESILSGGSSSMMDAQEEGMGGETSFLSDLAVSGMGGGTIQSDEGEVDPLTEADVFMAYGRNQQAEEVLAKALEKNPERLDLTAKLLEVYYNLKDNEKFVALAVSAESLLKGDEEAWGKVAAMGHEIAPDNSLFEAAGAAAVSAPSETGAHVSNDVLDIGLDIDELTAEMESEGAGDDLGIDLGLDFGDLEEESSTATEQAAEPEETMAFDLDLGATEEPAAEEESMGFDLDAGFGGIEEETPAAETEEISFDLGELGGGEEPVDEISLDLGGESEAAAGEEEISMDFDLGSLGGEEEISAPAEETLDLGDVGDIDFGDLGLDTGIEETATESAEAAGELDLSSAVAESSTVDDFADLSEFDDDSLLGDSDEIATKLDLAQAYIEMGDNEGARSMLEEVADAGNDEQKQQAQELLSKI